MPPLAAAPLPSTRARLALLGAVLTLVLAGGARAEEEGPPPGIAWHTDLVEAFAAARELDKPLMIAINARRVDGGRAEPAARELRENTYRDPRVVALAEERFVCAFLTPTGSSEDYGELRLRYGIDGQIVSPQHIFAFPDGSLIDRKEYWPYGSGEKAVEALLDLMQKALARDAVRRGEPAPTPGEPGEAPPEGVPGGLVDIPDAPGTEDEEGRAAWLADRLEEVKGLDAVLREAAVAKVAEADVEGDLLEPLLDLLDDLDDRPDAQIDILRGLGRPGLEEAVDAVEDFLRERDDLLRANAAVTLEYIGSDEAVRALTSAAKREDVDWVANEMYRALGRCGAGKSAVRKLLAKKVIGAKSTLASYGPIIGLAYFESDARTAREVEDLIQKVGTGRGRRGGWGGAWLKRGLLVWALTECGFGDPKAEAFVREELIPSVTPSPFADVLLDFYEAAATCCAGDESGKEAIEAGILRALERSRLEDNPFLTEARRDRDHTLFRPKAEWGNGGS